MLTMLTSYITKVRLSKPWHSHCAILWTEVQTFFKIHQFFKCSFSPLRSNSRSHVAFLSSLSPLYNSSSVFSRRSWFWHFWRARIDYLVVYLTIWICAKNGFVSLSMFIRQCLIPSHAYLDLLVKLTSVKFLHCKIIFSFVVDKYLGEMFWDCGNSWFSSNSHQKKASAMLFYCGVCLLVILDFLLIYCIYWLEFYCVEELSLIDWLISLYQ